MTGSTGAAARIPLLARMQRDFREAGSLRPSTTAAMYAAYAGHAVTTSAALRGRWLALPLPREVACLVGAPPALVGVALCVAGMRTFSGPGQVSGTRSGPLATRGVYRYSRNPQYLGYLLAQTGLAVARRSGAGLLGAALATAVYAAWIPVEEEHLARTVGGPYLRYAATTRRWWGRRPGP